MQISYDLTKNDVIAFARQVQTIRTTLRFTLLLGVAILLLSPIFVLISNAKLFIEYPVYLIEHTVISGIQPTAIVMVAVFFFMYYGVPYFACRQYFSAGTSSVSSKIEITPQDIHQIVGRTDNHVQWRAIKKITQDRQCLYLFYTNTAALIVPKRAFSSPEQAREFYELALSYWRGTGAAPIPAAPEQKLGDAFTDGEAVRRTDVVEAEPHDSTPSTTPDEQGSFRQMQVTFSLTASDYMRFYRTTQTPRRIISGLVMYVVFSFVVTLASTISSNLRQFLAYPMLFVIHTLFASLPIIGIGLVCMIIFIYSLSPRIVTRRQTANSEFFFPRTILITEKLIRYDTRGVSDNQVEWSGVKKIMHDSQTIFLYYAKNAAFIVPKRAFATPTQAEEFYQLAMAYWKGTPLPEISKEAEQEVWPPAPKR